MRFDQKLEKADVIIGLGSTDTRTAGWCAKLYHEGYAPFILFTGGRGRISRDVFEGSEAELYAKLAISLGVPDEAILRETEAANTGQNISLSYELLKRRGLMCGKIILVTKPYMLRRAYATFMKQWPDPKKPEIICSAIDVTLDEYCRNELYPFDYVVKVMVGDLQRIREYPKQGFQIEQNIPQPIWNAYERLTATGYTKHLLS
jgi:uncharacterized SAM-binding protein YcdF (DUF218 family)